ncbi:SIP domain-containing protein [Microbacterium sp. ZXX196]|uniref:SIP domain-containing protein n=1 Tax=Microbacterium sp. ZXX196 TaxID=2609291 RepID=UPI0012B73639|nr:SIP domain-containing protein [Microbacterium sp. ZXX196]MTE23060.1 phage tail protein [Microbacterium sp. ZXX196]
MTAPTSLPTHDGHACRARRHARAQHLVVADETTLVELETLLATLPLCASGRVFVEVPDASWIGRIAAPARMQVTWLDRASRRGAPGSAALCRPGEAMTRAAIAYADETLCDDAAAETRVTLLGGYVATADIVEHLTSRRGVAREHITVRDALAAYV